MWRHATIAALSVLLSPSVFGLSVKVLAVDQKKGEVVLLMPMHNTRIIGRLPKTEPEIRVRANEYYKARIEPGAVDTTRRNILRIEIPKRGPVHFRILRIAFLE